MCFSVLIFILLAASWAEEQNSRKLSLSQKVTVSPIPEITSTSATLPVESRIALTNKSSADTQRTKMEIPTFCLPTYKKPKMPNFSKPGRRISEQKCNEYIWKLTNRAEDAKRNEICKEYQFKRVLGGKTVLPGVFPHMGAIGWKAAVGSWVFKCGGSLISEKFVLTAAHCSKTSPRDSSIADIVPKIVRIGDRTLLDHPNLDSEIMDKVDKKISTIIVHPQYKSPKQYYDIALIKLEDKVIFTAAAQPACLWSSLNTSELGKHANVTGWGVVESGSLENSPDLLEAEVDLFELDRCNGLLRSVHNRNWDGVEDHQICAGKLEGGVDSCQGDSGGPLQVKIPLPKNITDAEGHMHYVIGIISFGIDCGLPNLPGVYTRVSSFIDWIEDNVWKK